MPTRLFSWMLSFFSPPPPIPPPTHTEFRTHTHPEARGKEFPVQPDGGTCTRTSGDTTSWCVLLPSCPHASTTFNPPQSHWAPGHWDHAQMFFCSLVHSVILAVAGTNPLAPSQATGFFFSLLSLPKQIDFWHLPLCFHPLKGGKLKAWLRYIHFHAFSVLSCLDVKRALSGRTGHPSH